MNDNVILLDHPLIQHKLTLLRDKSTGSKEFRELLDEIAMLMGYEVTRDLPLKEIDIETPMGKARSRIISGKKLAVIAILRAGLGMTDGILQLVPAAKVGHIGLYRDPNTLKPVDYYCKLPSDIQERDVILVDPMLATGGSASEAISLLKQKGARSIKLMCLIASTQGIAYISGLYPDVNIYTAAIDEKLDEHGYIVPGLGDAGDRLFGTK